MLGRKKTNVFVKRSFSLRALDPPISPYLDFSVAIISLTDTKMRIGAEFFERDDYSLTSVYDIKLSGDVVIGMAGVITVGISKVVKELMSRVYLYPPPNPRIHEALSRSMGKVSYFVNRWPRLLIALIEISPRATLSYMRRIMSDMKPRALGPSGRSVSLHKVFEMLPPFRYGDHVSVVDGKEIDDYKKAEDLYIEAVADETMSFLILIANASKIPLLFGVDVPFISMGKVPMKNLVG